jgi:hypothetical protein
LNSDHKSGGNKFSHVIVIYDAARLDEYQLSSMDKNHFTKIYQKGKNRLYADLKKHEQKQEEGAINYPPFPRKKFSEINVLCIL